MLKRLTLFASLTLVLSVAHAQSVPDPTSTDSGSGQSDANCQDSMSATCVPQGSSSSGYPGSMNGSDVDNNQRTQNPAASQYGALPNQTPNRQLTAPSYRDEDALPNQQDRRYRSQQLIQPEPLTEFQKFVAETTGQILPIFGAGLFQHVPSTFAPVDQIPIPADAVVGPGDLLRVRIWGQVNFSANLRVDRSGEIYLPQVGPVHVAGIKYSDLNEQLRSAMSRVYRNFNVAVELGQIRSIQIYVVGRAQRPGTYTVSSLSSLIDTLFSSGGPSLEGSLRHIQLKRGGQVIADLDLYDLLVNGDKSGDKPLEPGDVIYIPAVGPQIAVVGSVKTPAIYEELGSAAGADQTVGQVLKQAAGISNVAGGAELSLERMQPEEGRAAESIRMTPEGLATRMHDGDILRVQPRVPQYARTVTLRGNTANPGRYAWHAGMRLSELIPDRQSLLTRNYLWQRANAGLPAPEFLRSSTLDLYTQQPQPVTLPTVEQERARMLRQQERESAAYLQRQQAAQTAQQQQDQSTDSGTSPLTGTTLNAGDAARLQSQSTNLYVDDGWAPFDPNSTDAFRLGDDGTRQRQDTSITDATARRDARTENTSNARSLTRVTVPAPEIDWQYAVVERLDKETLKTSLLPFDLGRLVADHDPSQDLELQTGDVVTIFSQADIHVPQEQQTKYVRLEGEFVHAGVYSTRPGENLRDLVQRAGGFAAGAYLFGSEFDRVSVRAVQQRRLDDYIQKLQLQIERGILATSAAASTSAANLASASVAGTQARELVSRLQQIRASGRIVLDLHAFSGAADNLPPLALEDGDTFYVPSTPSNVSVIGAVYDQNSFLYKAGHRVPDYLHEAGGASRDADRAHPYVIRADGSVLSQDQIGDKKFKQIVIQPGDTIVMSEKTFGPTKLRDFLNFSQLFAQLAIGAAVVSNL